MYILPHIQYQWLARKTYLFAPVRCCFDVMFLLFASLFALSVHQALRCFRSCIIVHHSKKLFFNSFRGVSRYIEIDKYGSINFFCMEGLEIPHFSLQARTVIFTIPPCEELTEVSEYLCKYFCEISNSPYLLNGAF